MRSQERDNGSRVDEDDEIGYNHEGWAWDLAPLHVSIAFFAAREIVTTFEQDTRYDRKSSRKANKRVGYGHREAVGARACVAGNVSKRHPSSRSPYPAMAVAKTRYIILMNVTICFLV